jgi:hypothetical protein
MGYTEKIGFFLIASDFSVPCVVRLLLRKAKGEARKAIPL